MYSKLISALSRAIWDSDLIATRLILALGEFFWAFMLIIWGGSQHLFSRPTYTQMAQVMSEEAWGAVFLISAILQLTIVLQDDLHSKFARYFSAFNACLWSYVCISMLLSVYPPPAAIGGEFALATSAIWIWIRPYILVEGIRRARQH